jgi:hypothetical protein
MDQNSQNYSALKTPVPPGSKLPQIVVQMPVYKESLEEVSKPLARRFAWYTGYLLCGWLSRA